MTYEEEMQRRLKLLGEWILEQEGENIYITIKMLKRKLEKLDIIVDE